MKTDQTTPKYKRYDAAFKHSAVEHWMLSGQSAQIIAGELGIKEQSLHKWEQRIQSIERRSGGRDTLEQLQAENRRFQRAMHRVVPAAGYSKKPWA